MRPVLIKYTIMPVKKQYPAKGQKQVLAANKSNAKLLHSSTTKCKCMNIVITGASSGIGYEIVKAFARLGNHQIIGIARSADKLHQLAGEVGQMNPHIQFRAVPYDLHTLRPGQDTLKSAIQQRLPSQPINCLINNAGYLVKKPFEQMNASDAADSFQLNTLAPAWLIQQLLPLMATEPRSHVLNVSSMAGYQGSVKFPELSFYSASKAALAALTEALAVEYAVASVAFNCLAIGATQTEMFARAFPGGQAPVSARTMGEYIAHFALNGHKLYNGKVLPVALSTP